MKARCKNPGNSSYHNYGAKGIKVCDRWQTFMNFKEDMFDDYIDHVKTFSRKQTLIDRIDSTKGYFPENCKWSTRFEQNRNTNRNVFIEFDGKRLTMSEWSRVLGIHRSTVYKRIFIWKWPIERALTIKK